MKRYSTIMSVLLTLALPVAAMSADTPKAAEKAAAPAAEKAAPPAAESKEKPKGSHSMMGGGAAAGSEAITGKVVETMNGGGYSYANLEKDGKTTWVAYPSLETRVGENLTFRGCMEMKQFESKSLKKKFDSIFFCGAPEVKGKTEAKAAPAKKEKGDPNKPIKVAKAEGPNAYTVAEIFSKRAALNGKQVVVKGMVTRVSSGIMNKNWIHLQDGTGSEKKKTNDLVVTSTSAAPEVGDIVTMTGTVAKDKNFGSGYKYDAIIEKGVVKK